LLTPDAWAICSIDVAAPSGRPRRTPVGGKVIDGSFWLVAEHGLRSHYVRNIQASPRVRLRTGSHWQAGTAHLLPDEDPRALLKRLPWSNSLMVRLLGTDLLAIRIDLHEPKQLERPVPGSDR